MSAVRLSWLAVALGVVGAAVAIWIGWLGGHLSDVASNLPPWVAFGAMGAIALSFARKTGRRDGWRSGVRRSAS